MSPQLGLNQGAEDALLFDNTRSYFTNVGYTRTSNFQMELRDIDPQTQANLGATVNFVIPKAADLLGPCDLLVDFATAITSPGDTGEYWGWVENVGYAMIDKVSFSVGTHEVESITGEQLNIMNELMRSDQNRYGYHNIMKTGRPLVHAQFSTTDAATGAIVHDTTSSDPVDRIIAYNTTKLPGKKMIIPLGLFFMSHPSKYFPLAAIAGCNEVRISVKLRNKDELVMCHGHYTHDAGAGGSGVIIHPTEKAADCHLNTLTWAGNNPFTNDGSIKLRCHYIHVTGPESNALANREHVRLMQLWNGNEIHHQQAIKCSAAGHRQTVSLDLPYLHPVKELIITIRKVSEMGSKTTNNIAIGAAASADKAAENTAQVKNYFAYHGGGVDPNLESHTNCCEQEGTVATAEPTYLKTDTFQLKLNGQSRHLDGKGIDRNYLMNRLMPMMHSNTSTTISQVADNAAYHGSDVTNGGLTRDKDWKTLAGLVDRKEIYCFPFALNPEGANPSGSVNFSKVSHAKLEIHLDGFAPSASGVTEDVYQFDVYGIYYNWLAIKDGRALLSFA